jgi:hypothetical protein
LPLKTLFLISLLSEILPLIFCIFFYRKITAKELKVFFVYTIFQSIFTILCALATYKYNSYTAYVFFLRIHVFVEYALISYFFYLIIVSKFVRILILASIIPFLLFCIYDQYRIGNTQFGNNPSLAEYFILILLIIFYLFEKMKFSYQIPIYYTINFWLCVGFFVYLTGTFFYILLVINIKSEGQSFKNQLLVVNSVITIIKNLILSLAFIQQPEFEVKENDQSDFPPDLNLDGFTANSNIN